MTDERVKYFEALADSEHYSMGSFAYELLDEVTRLRSALSARDEAIRVAEGALSRGKLFIEYARYELEPGKAGIGDQFPRRVDADEHIALLVAALSALAAAKVRG